MEYVYLNNEFLKTEEAKISVLEPGLLFGFGLFETIRAHKSKLFRPEAHWRRLYSGAAKLGLIPGLSPSDLTAVCHELLQRNQQKEAAVRVSLYKGIKEDVLVVHLRDDWFYPPELYQTGVKIIVGAYPLNEKSPLYPLKTTSRLTNALTHKEAETKGALEGLILNTEGKIAEGSRSNIFWVKDGGVYTPPLSDGGLAGVTRKIVFELARENRINAKEKSVTPVELTQADEVFLTSTLLEVMPINMVDEKKIGEACPGPATTLLHSSFRKLVSKEMG